MSFIRYSILLPLLLVFSTTTIAVELNPEKWTPRDEDLRLLQMRVEQYKLEDVLPTYQRKDYLLVPLGYLSEILDLAINVDIGTGIAQGFIFNEEKTFYLDTSRSEVTISGINQSYNKQLVFVLDDDIYVDSRLLSEWLNITINVDLLSATIAIKSEDKFPFILRMEREEKIARAKANLNQDVPYYPYHYEPYDMWDVPFIDQTFEGSSLNNDAGSNHTLRSTTYMTSDLLGMEASMYAFVTNDKSQDDFRFSMGKKDPEGELLGVARATEYVMGSLTEPRLKNITVPADQEPGVLISNFPLNRQDEYDRHRFIGNLLPGWEVELYRNDRLIGYQSVADNGQYDFEDIAILFGRNNFRLVFYGPQGQVREETEVFELGQSLTEKGKHYYRALASDNSGGGSRALAQYDVGLSDQISASFVGASIPLDVTSSKVEQHNYMQAGLRGFWKSFFATVDFIDDVDGGEAVNVDLQTGIGSTVLKINHTAMNNFFSEEYQLTAQEYKSNTEFRIDTAIPPTFLPRIPISFELTMADFVEGNDRNELVNLLSMQTYGLSFSNQLTYVQNSTSDNRFNGTFGLSSDIYDVGVRGTVNYEFQPKDEIKNVDLTARPPLYKNFQFTYGLNHSIQANRTAVSASASKAIGDYNLSFGASYDTDDSMNLSARLSMGIGREPRKKTWDTDALAMANRGSVSARVYLDNNQDGIFNEGDVPIEDAGFTVNGGYQRVKTDKDGIAFITGLPDHKPVNLAIRTSSLEDPLWIAAIDGMRIVPRPGKAMQLDFPVFTSGEVDGTVYLLRDEKTVAAGRVKVEVVDSHGNVVKSATTEYDGFYVVTGIPLGVYTVRISPDQLTELNLRVENQPAIAISADDQFKSGIDFKLLNTPQ